MLKGKYYPNFHVFSSWTLEYLCMMHSSKWNTCISYMHAKLTSSFSSSPFKPALFWLAASHKQQVGGASVVYAEACEVTKLRIATFIGQAGLWTHKDYLYFYTRWSYLEQPDSRQVEVCRRNTLILLRTVFQFFFSPSVAAVLWL